ncbi:DUF6869 domain-containing protein [Stutzerimonas kunmingensis]|jgi:hypothetical protein|uniref:DUF6869 domain-containing protein n=2 Tax=Gammaproteobacteria TaxID=1236 RepID=UPI0035E3C35A
MTSQTELVFAYFAHYRTKDSSLYWAWEAVDDAMHELEHGLPLCLGLIDASENDAELAYVAAGPLEDLLMRVGAPAANALEEPVRSSIKARLTLTCVWLSPEAEAYHKWHSLVEQYPHQRPGVDL